MKYQPNYNGSFALVIGINDYRHASPLEIDRADAQSIQEVLIRNFGFPKANVSLLLDGKATHKGIMERFLAYESLNPDDRLLVFFAGHGATVRGSRGHVGYLVPVDGRLENKSTLIRWDDLTRNADLIPAKHIFFIMDACYSGLAIQRVSRVGEQRFVTDMMQRSSRQVITAGKADEVVADGGGPTGNNSIFTGHLIEGMNGAASTESGVITASGLMHYTYRKVSSDSRSNQTPHFGHIDGDGDFVLKTPEDALLKAGPTVDFLVKAVAERPEPPAIFDPTISSLGFAEKRGYADPESPTFGRNEWTKKLGKFRWEGDASKPEPAFGWLSLIVEPVSNEPVNCDLSSLVKTLPGKRGEGFDPRERFEFPSQAMTTAKSLLLYEPEYARNDSSGECWKRFLRIEQNNSLEFCEFARVARKVSLRQDGANAFPVFHYVQTIGLVWTFLYASKRLLDSAGYTAGVRYVVSLVGTSDTTLIDFAAGKGKDNKKWRDLFDDDIFGSESFSKWKCHDPNLQFQYQLVIGSMGESEVFAIVRDCAERLGLAYNHQSPPRCFNFETEDFPWTQFEARGR